MICGVKTRRTLISYCFACRPAKFLTLSGHRCRCWVRPANVFAQTVMTDTNVAYWPARITAAKAASDND
jgi:hypothetical protein